MIRKTCPATQSASGPFFNETLHYRVEKLGLAKWSIKLSTLMWQFTQKSPSSYAGTLAAENFLFTQYCSRQLLSDRHVKYKKRAWRRHATHLIYYASCVQKINLESI